MRGGEVSLPPPAGGEAPAGPGRIGHAFSQRSGKEPPVITMVCWSSGFSFMGEGLSLGQAIIAAGGRAALTSVSGPDFAWRAAPPQPLTAASALRGCSKGLRSKANGSTVLAHKRTST